MILRRRQFLRLLGVTAVGGTVPISRSVWAQARSERVLVCVFQRGAVDGLSMVVPHGDAEYYLLRREIAIAPPRRGERTRAVDLDGHFGLHPALAPLKSLWDAGELAVVHAVGSPHPTRSHFEAQHHMESGALGFAADRRGWLNRLLQAAPNTTSLLSGIALTDSVPEAMRGDADVFAISDLRAARRPARGVVRQRLNAAAQALFADEDDPFTRHGRSALEILARLGDVRRRHGDADNGASYPRGPAGNGLADVARLVKANVGLRVAFVDVGGWDTHNHQGGAADGRLAPRLAKLADALRAFRIDLGARFENVVVLTMSEFGRTAAQNGTGGTDHGHGTAMLVTGGPVRGGRVRGRWPGLAPERLYEGRDLSVTTDFRGLFAEIADRHMGVTSPAALFPGYQPTPSAYPGVLPQP